MTARVYLERPTARRELEFLTAGVRSRPLYRGFVVPPASAGDYRDYLARARRASQESFFVIERESQALAGVVDVNEIERDPVQSGRVGYYAFAPWAGSGLMRAGLALVIAAAFRELGLDRLEAHIQKTNARSIALAEALGFRREGAARRVLKIGNRWRDHESWALVKKSWRGSAPLELTSARSRAAALSCRRPCAARTTSAHR